MTKIRILISLLIFVSFPIFLFGSVEVVGSLKSVYSVNPGETVKGQIRIQNSDETNQEVRIYQTDLLYNLQDQTFYDEPGTKGGNKRSNAGWIQYSPKTVILKPKESRNIDYEITIPKNDSIFGTYWSVIMVEGVEPIDPVQKAGLNIRTVTRYAVQLVNECTNKGKGSLEFLPPTLIKEESKLFLAVDISNNGDHYIAPDLTMELYDENGVLVKTITALKKGLFPSTSLRFKLDLEGVPSKKTYKAMIVAAGQEDDVFGLEYTLYF